jgi:hypothetical protein
LSANWDGKEFFLNTTQVDFRFSKIISSFQFYRLDWLDFMSFSTWTCSILIEVYSIGTILKSHKNWIICELWICFPICLKPFYVTSFICVVLTK